MYVCDIHGELESIWCDKCSKEVTCKCKTEDSARYKDLIYELEDGSEKTFTIRLFFCPTCGNINSLDY